MAEENPRSVITAEPDSACARPRRFAHRSSESPHGRPRHVGSSALETRRPGDWPRPQRRSVPEWGLTPGRGALKRLPCLRTVLGAANSLYGNQSLRIIF